MWKDMHNHNPYHMTMFKVVIIFRQRNVEDVEEPGVRFTTDSFMMGSCPVRVQFVASTYALGCRGDSG